MTPRQVRRVAKAEARLTFRQDIDLWDSDQAVQDHIDAMQAKSAIQAADSRNMQIAAAAYGEEFQALWQDRRKRLG